MFTIRNVPELDNAFWFTFGMHLSENEFLLKVRDKRGYVGSDGNKAIGVMQYNLIWDNTPFFTFIYFGEVYRDKGFGRQTMLF